MSGRAYKFEGGCHRQKYTPVRFSILPSAKCRFRKPLEAYAVRVQCIPPAFARAAREGPMRSRGDRGVQATEPPVPVLQLSLATGRPDKQPAPASIPVLCAT